MPLSRAAKKVKVDMLAGELAGSTSAIIGTFAGLTASKDFELRKTVRAAGGSYHVVKNKLAAKASSGTKIEAALQGLKGVSAVAYTTGDPVALAKALSGWVKDNAEFTFKLGIVEGKVISVEDIGALATMPGKEELFSKLLFLIQSPAQRLVTVLNAAGRDLAVVINQAVEEGKFAASAAPAAVAAPEAGAPIVAASQSLEAPGAEAAATEVPEEVPKAEAPPSEVSRSVAPAAEAPAAEAQVEQVPVAEFSQVPMVEASATVNSSADLIVEAHAVEAPRAETEATQPEHGTTSQAGEAASTGPVEGRDDSVEE